MNGLPFHCRVYGLPLAQGRPRAARFGSGVRVYDPATSRDWKRTIQAQVLTIKPTAPFDCPLAMELSFIFPRPKSLPKRVLHHTKRPDIDNLFKAVSDALNGILYRDDSLIVQLVTRKVYGEEPGVAIHLYELDAQGIILQPIVAESRKEASHASESGAEAKAEQLNDYVGPGEWRGWEVSEWRLKP